MRSFKSTPSHFVRFWIQNGKELLIERVFSTTVMKVKRILKNTRSEMLRHPLNINDMFLSLCYRHYRMRDLIAKILCWVLYSVWGSEIFINYTRNVKPLLCIQS